jgi:selenobiotic family peptide radical SAM maturase
VAEVDRLIIHAMEQGLLLAPVSRIRRDPSLFAIPPETPVELLSTSVFTLQWHITQNCDLHCKHCYDRSERTSMPLKKGLAVLDDLYRFCCEHQVRGQISFSGGNPLLYPYFFELYQAAADKGFEVAILGNPASQEKLEQLLAVREPAFFQVSIEGLEAHNDMIRGPGHFQRVIAFLQMLRAVKIYSMVMLTLTKDNMAQVIPLAEILRDKVDLFTFNRLAMVGEGAVLQSVPVGEYNNFLEAFIAATEKNPCLRLKDNLINIIRHQQGQKLFGGCAGHGCGAAFNFLCALPDGEIHACRKFPSLIGNIYEKSLSELYDSERARQYRAGCRACRDCKIRPACGGCLAVAHGFGLNIFEERDPYCFFEVPSNNRHD